jgi:hypothetical protein
MVHWIGGNAGTCVGQCIGIRRLHHPWSMLAGEGDGQIVRQECGSLLWASEMVWEGSTTLGA